MPPRPQAPGLPPSSAHASAGRWDAQPRASPRGSRRSLSAAAGPASKVAQLGPRAGRGWGEGRKRRAAVARARGLVQEAPDSSPRATFVCGALGAPVCSRRRERGPPLRSQGDKILAHPCLFRASFSRPGASQTSAVLQQPHPLPCPFPAGRCALRAGQKNPEAPGSALTAPTLPRRRGPRALDLPRPDLPQAACGLRVTRSAQVPGCWGAGSPCQELPGAAFQERRELTAHQGPGTRWPAPKRLRGLECVSESPFKLLPQQVN